MKGKIKFKSTVNNKLPLQKRENAVDKGLTYEWEQINYFFEWFDVDAATQHFWEILKLALVADNDHTDELERSNMIFFYEAVKKLIENVYELLIERKKG